MCRRIHIYPSNPRKGVCVRYSYIRWKVERDHLHMGHDSFIHTHICAIHTYTHMYVHPGIAHLCVCVRECVCFSVWIYQCHIYVYIYKYIYTSIYARHHTFSTGYNMYGVATISRLLKIVGLFCTKVLWKRRYSAKETYYFKEPANRSHPICIFAQALAISIVCFMYVSITTMHCCWIWGLPFCFRL